MQQVGEMYTLVKLDLSVLNITGATARMCGSLEARNLEQ